MSDEVTMPEAGEVLPVTLVAAGSGGGSEIAYGDKRVNWPGKGDDFHQFWFAVFDRSDLSLVANVVSDSSSTVPAEIQKYAGNVDYILAVVTNALGYAQVPTGDLATFLADNGGGSGLTAAEQVAEQAGSAAGGRFVYALMSILGEPIAGIEGFSNGPKVVVPLSLRKFGESWTPVNAPA